MNGNGLEREITDQKENEISIAAKMIRNFQETKHPVLTGISALSRGMTSEKSDFRTFQR